MLKATKHLYLTNRKSADSSNGFKAAPVAAICLYLSVAGSALAYDTSFELDGDSTKLALAPYVVENEEVVSTTTTSYSLSGTTVLQSKLFDKETGQLRDVVIDMDSGGVTEIGAVRAEEERRWLQIHGALDLSLVQRLQTAAPGEKLEIVIFSKDDGAEIQDGKGKKSKDPLDAIRSALRKSGVRGAKSYPDEGHVRVLASAEDVRQVIAFLPGVAAAYPWEESATLGLKAARDLIQEPLVSAHTNGFGTHLTIAVDEPEACINRAHPDFQYVTFDERIGFDVNCQTGREGLHTTPVAGMLAAIRLGETSESIGLYQGHLFDVESGSSASMYARNPEFINISATTSASRAKSLDEAVYKQRIFIANGSGNDSNVARCYSYNALCVGGYSHKNTLGKGQFGDDAPVGSWLNDPESGREEPDVVGPYSVSSAKASGFGYTSENGTSFSTPSITGLAALLTANFEADLGRDPTLLRAVLMASASHPISNPDTTAPNVPAMNDGIDDRSGAGAPRGDRGKAILQERNFLSASMDRDVDFTIGGKLDRSISFEAAGGNIVRVVLAWDQCPVNVLSTRDALVADLDMVIDGPGAPMTVCDPSKGCDSGGDDTGGSYPDSGLAIDDGYNKLATTTSPTYSTTSYSTYTYTATSTETSLATEEPVLAPVEDTSSTLRVDSTIFALSGLTFNKSYFSNPSAVDNYEILEFKAPATGTYNVNITTPRWDRCPYDGGMSTNVAVAWDTLSGSDL